ncbi:unnamed protein product [Closterium sp. NIES-54]
MKGTGGNMRRLSCTTMPMSFSAATTSHVTRPPPSSPSSPSPPDPPWFPPPGFPPTSSDPDFSAAPVSVVAADVSGLLKC